MPDYSKTKIYEIVSKNEEIKSRYIGSSTNYKTRVLDHKKRCINSNQPAHNFKVYKFIRENGGWDNWNIKIIEEFMCNNKREQFLREKYWMNEKNCDLNSKKPIK